MAPIPVRVFSLESEVLVLNSPVFWPATAGSSTYQGRVFDFRLLYSVFCLLYAVPRFRWDKLLPFYFPASIFLFIKVAVTAAEKPLSILTTVTPAVQLLSIVRSADRPSKFEP